jgi:hypothetical protein
VTAEQISELVQSSNAAYSTPNEYAKFYCEPTNDGVSIPGDDDIRDLTIDAENQICVAPAGIPIGFLHNQLAVAGHCLPFPTFENQEDPAREGNRKFAIGLSDRLSLRQAIDLNLPHAAESQCGNWRDWIIGMTVVLGDGTIAKSGSRAVKNVAGYDAHKLFIGARGTLGIITEVILRIRPAKSRVTPNLVWGPYRAAGPVAIHRVLPTDFEQAKEEAGEDLVLADPATATIWRRNGEITRYPHDWLLRTGEAGNQEPMRLFLERAKKLLDPENKLNPGLLGIF